MTKSRLASVLDACLIALSTLIITLIIFSRIKVNIIIKILICSIISSIAFFLYIKREKKLYKNQQLKLHDKIQCIQTITSIKLMSSKEKQTYFEKVFNDIKSQENIASIGYTISSVDNLQSPQSLLQKIIDDNTENNFDKYFVLLLDDKENNELIEKYKTLKKKDIIILSPQDLYNTIKQHSSLPDLSGFAKIKTSLKEKLQIFIQNLLYKSNAKGFFISGALLFISSLFMPFKTYYHMVTLILLTISLICLIFGKKTKTA